jgi:UDP-N-acetylmuramyl pentapeptide phosphotransferase/UDP-N-acetylglucosamine-1-phosphate transferase
VSHRLRTGAVAAAASAAAGQALLASPPGGAERWGRTNHRGEPVTLLEGPAYAAGAIAGVVLAAGTPARLRAAATLATTVGAGLGGYDDLAGDSSSRGLGGHLKALLRGEVSTGTVKLAGLGLCGLAAAALVPSRPGEADHGPRRWADVATSGALIAGTANLVNLLDLRPGRALKVVTALGAVTTLAGGASGSIAAAAVGPALAQLPADLGERAMLGDTGANAAGALLGTAWVARLPRAGRLCALAAVTALNLASERVSFTKVIEQTPALHALDQLGRRPPEPTS